MYSVVKNGVEIFHIIFKDLWKSDPQQILLSIREFLRALCKLDVTQVRISGGSLEKAVSHG